jgi:manganese/iron transport system permease protein
MIAFFSVFGIILLAVLLGGGTAGLTGVFVMGLRMPFLAVCSAHAAMAGAVYGVVLQERFGVALPADAAGFAGALLGAALLAYLLRRRSLDPNMALGALFSLMLGLTFLGIGLIRGPKSAAFGLLWGSPLFVTPGQTAVMAAVGVLLGVFLYVFHKELKVLLFSREMAAVLVPQGWILAALLILIAGVITINLEIAGGLLLFSLLTNPALAALRVARSYRATLAWSCLFGAASALGGFLLAYALDLPAGACIVLFSCAVLWGAAVWGKKRVLRTEKKGLSAEC